MSWSKLRKRKKNNKIKKKIHVIESNKKNISIKGLIDRMTLDIIKWGYI